MNQRSHRGLFWSVALAGFLLDQASKYSVFKWLYNDGAGGDYEIIPGVFRFVAQFTRLADPGNHFLSPLRTWGGVMQPRVNPGSLFSLAIEYAGAANAVFATVSSIVAVALIVWSCRPGTMQDRWLCISLSLVLAGTTGNLYDRVVFNGVRDFLYFYWIEWPVFNVADCFLVCGAAMLLIRAFWKRSPEGIPQHRTSGAP